jgi:hypothetical protein
MRKSSKVGFAASLGLAILSASLVSDFSSDGDWPGFLSFANAGIPGAATSSLFYSAHPSQGAILPAEIRRRALMNRVQQRLQRQSSSVDPILL